MNCGTGWRWSTFFYVLAIIFIVMAIICSLWNFFTTTGTVTDWEQRISNGCTYLYFLSLVFAVLALTSHSFEMRDAMYRGVAVKVQ